MMIKIRKQTLVFVFTIVIAMIQTVDSHLFFPSPAVAFAGFGTPLNKKQKKKRKKPSKQSNVQNRQLNTPQDRMNHIKKRIEAADVSRIAELSLQQQNDGQIALNINPNAVAVVDNFLGDSFLREMRKEAISLMPQMVPSQSTKWDEKSQSVVPYEKVGVMSTQIEGGAEGYKASPRLVEYIVTLTTHLTHKLNQMLPESHHLKGEEQTNKLAVCLGDGSMYDKHIDNLGGDNRGEVGGDRRKLTALLYLQPSGSHDGQPSYPNESVDDDPRGGYFRAYDVPSKGDVSSIAPRGDRLLLFWSDSLVHDVSPSFTPNGDADHRWALTIWFIAKDSASIRATDTAVEERHFGLG